MQKVITGLHLHAGVDVDPSGLRANTSGGGILEDLSLLSRRAASPIVPAGSKDLPASVSALECDSDIFVLLHRLEDLILDTLPEYYGGKLAGWPA